MPLGLHLGWRGLSGPEREARARAWMRAGRAAIESDKYRCEAVANATGERCRRARLRGARCCLVHLRGPERFKADLEREERYRRTLERGDIPSRMERARKGLAAIARTRLRSLWRQDPRAHGSTLELSERDEALVVAFLREACGLDVERPLLETGKLLTPRSLDRVRHSAWRAVKRRAGGTLTPAFSARIVECVSAVVRDEIRFWQKWERLGGNDETT